MSNAAIKNERLVLQTDQEKVGYKTKAGNGKPVARVDDLRHEVARGFLDTHTRLHSNAGKILESASFSYALIELLVEKGLISIEELDARQQIVRRRLVETFAEQGIGVVALQEFEQDKYAYDAEQVIDCRSRLHLCRAACCRMNLALSTQDVEEGIVKWDLARPYMIARDPDGYCRHLARATCRCTVWEHRPIPCRGYDCRDDARIWLDFEARLINPDLDEEFGEARSGIAPTDGVHPSVDGNQQKKRAKAQPPHKEDSL